MIYKPEDQALIRFANTSQMEGHLAGLIGAHVALSIAQRGRASLALSGGRTPRGLYARLSQTDLDWAKVDVTLVDERFVPADHEASNEKLVRETLLQNNASAANFISLKGNAKTPEKAADNANTALARLFHPLDVVVLGMGEDGHTASWFAGAAGLDAALDPQNPALCVPITARQSLITGPYTKRLTLSISALKDARLCVLVLNGADKKEAYSAALEPGPAKAMPVRGVLRLSMDNFWPCWSP